MMGPGSYRGEQLPRRLPGERTSRGAPGRNIAVVGGVKIPPVGYVDRRLPRRRQGVAGTTVLIDYSQDFIDQALCKEKALEQIADGSQGRLQRRRPVRARRPRRREGARPLGHRR